MSVSEFTSLKLRLEKEKRYAEFQIFETNKKFETRARELINIKTKWPLVILEICTSLSDAQLPAADSRAIQLCVNELIRALLDANETEHRMLLDTHRTQIICLLSHIQTLDESINTLSNKLAIM